jgi:hypothetical protein
MSKRGWTPDSGAPPQRYTKRPRYESGADELPEEIVTARHLQALLIFEQDVPRLLDGNISGLLVVEIHQADILQSYQKIQGVP